MGASNDGDGPVTLDNDVLKAIDMLGRPCRASIYELNLRSTFGQSTGATPVGEGGSSIAIETSIFPTFRIVTVRFAMDELALRLLEELRSIASYPGFKRPRRNRGFLDVSLHGRTIRLLERRWPSWRKQAHSPP